MSCITTAVQLYWWCIDFSAVWWKLWNFVCSVMQQIELWLPVTYYNYNKVVNKNSKVLVRLTTGYWCWPDSCMDQTIKTLNKNFENGNLESFLTEDGAEETETFDGAGAESSARVACRQLSAGSYGRKCSCTDLYCLNIFQYSVFVLILRTIIIFDRWWQKYSFHESNFFILNLNIGYFFQVLHFVTIIHEVSISQ